MQLPIAPAFLALTLFGITAMAADDATDWKVAAHSGDIVIYNRVRDGSPIREVKAVGPIDASPAVVRRVLDDAEEYPHFMPYVVETRVISRKENVRVSYQRISPPVIGDRDYTVRVRCETRKTADGVCYCNRWEAANDLGPAEKNGIARVKVNEGYWLLEPAGTGTRATYCLYSDSGGSLPAMIVNAGNQTAIPKLFEAVRKQAKLEKYQHAEN